MRRCRPYLKYVAVGTMLLALFLTRRTLPPSRVQEVAGISIDPADRGEYIFGFELAITDKANNFTVESKLLSIKASRLSEALESASLQNEFPLVLTHGSLIVLHGDLLDGRMREITQMLLEDWSGQRQVYMAVADGCDAADILRVDLGENLRSGQLSEQVHRACRQGKVDTEQALRLCSRYLEGEPTALPVVSALQDHYRITGSIRIRKAGAV